MIRFGIRAVAQRDHLGDNLLASLLTLVAGIFAFALIYHTYGLQSDTGFLTSVPPTDARLRAAEIEDTASETHFYFEFNNRISWVDVDRPPPPPPGAAGHEDGAIVVVPPDPTESLQLAPLVFLEPRLQMVDSKWDHLLFSLSNAIPGGNATRYIVCPSAAHFVILQNVFGLAMTIIITLLGARFSDRLTRSDQTDGSRKT